MKRSEADEIIAERQAAERDAFARRVVEVPSLTPADIAKQGAAFAEGYEMVRTLLLDELLEPEETQHAEE